MTKQNQNSISPFLVSNASKGAEKALIKMTAALLLKVASFVFPKV